MKSPPQSACFRRAFTLLEMTVVLMVLMSLIGSGLFVSKKVGDWRLGRLAADSLRAVYSAQRMLLADRPTLDVTAITATSDTTNGILPYLPNNATSLPTVKSLTGATLTFKVNVIPPYFTLNGERYDPSDCDDDSLWDVGE